jgi:hypothetical protein
MDAGVNRNPHGAGYWGNPSRFGLTVHVVCKPLKSRLGTVCGPDGYLVPVRGTLVGFTFRRFRTKLSLSSSGGGLFGRLVLERVRGALNFGEAFPLPRQGQPLSRAKSERHVRWRREQTEPGRYSRASEGLK